MVTMVSSESDISSYKTARTSTPLSCIINKVLEPPWRFLGRPGGFQMILEVSVSPVIETAYAAHHSGERAI